MMAASPRLQKAPSFLNFGHALKRISTLHKISYSQLADLCGGKHAGASRDFFYRLCNDQPINEQTLAQLRPRLAVGLLGFLIQRGLDRNAAFNQLVTCFEPEELTPMIVERTTLPPAVCKHFGLTRDPFTERPSTRSDVWMSTEHQRVIEQMLNAVNKQKFIALLGEVGSGKTTLKKVLVDQLAASDGQVKHKLLWPKAVGVKRITPANIERFILESFGQRSSADAIARTTRLEQTLESLYTDNHRVAIAFDECHRLTDDTLYALKDFYELGTGGFIAYIGIILIGQSEFTARLRDVRHSPLSQRIEVVQMPSIEKYAWEYVTHRLAKAGCENAETLFEKKAVEVLAAHASTPLALGNLCNRALRKIREYGEPTVTPQLLRSRMNLAQEPRIRSVKEA
jgi:type II secretory pathway predicted ATPase ExeA